MDKLSIYVSNTDLQEIKKFCELNSVEFDTLIEKCFKTGYNIEKYGLLGKTVRVEEKLVEVPVEKIVIQEVIKEVPIEKVVTKIEYICDNTKVDELLKKIEILESENTPQNNDMVSQLQTTIQNLMGKIRDKDKEINELKEQLINMKTNFDIKPAVYLRSSNLGDNLYKED